VRSDLQAFGTKHAQIGRLTRGETLVIGLEPVVVPDNTEFPFRLGRLSAGEARDLLDAHGRPYPSTHATADQDLVEIGFAASRSVGTPDAPCEPLAEPFVYEPPAEARPFYLRAPDTAVAVEVRRFGEGWGRLAQMQPRAAVAVTLQRVGSTESSEVRADGACRVLADATG
jgi:hypothetical protein